MLASKTLFPLRQSYIPDPTPRHALTPPPQPYTRTSPSRPLMRRTPQPLLRNPITHSRPITPKTLLIRRPVLQQPPYLIEAYRLREINVISTSETFCLISPARKSRQRNDHSRIRRFRFLLKVANRPGGFETVHDRHAHVCEDDLIRLISRCSLEQLDGYRAILGRGNLRALALLEEGRCARA
jgi:hypothetical protein